MERREFLALAAATGASLWLHGTAHAHGGGTLMERGAPGYGNLLILIELKGGNDGLNTVVPFADPLYYRYRPNLAVRRDQAIALDERIGLNPALAPLVPMWRVGQLAVVQGVGCPQPSLSHYRASEIWDTASRSDQYLRDGWLTRAFAHAPVSAGGSDGGLVFGSAEMGPFMGPAQTSASVHARASGSPLLRRPGQNLSGTTMLSRDAFDDSIEAAMHALAQDDAAPGRRIAAIRLTLHGFDTHQNQPLHHAVLLHRFAAGMVAMRGALIALGRWDRTLIVTYTEFGRSTRENPHRGTDHGTATPHFVAGGRVKGGLYGPAPQLTQLDGNGNLPFGIDFRQLHATVLGPWWGLDAQAVLQGRFRPLPILQT